MFFFFGHNNGFIHIKGKEQGGEENGNVNSYLGHPLASLLATSRVGPGAQVPLASGPAQHLDADHAHRGLHDNRRLFHFYPGSADAIVTYSMVRTFLSACIHTYMHA